MAREQEMKFTVEGIDYTTLVDEVAHVVGADVQHEERGRFIDQYFPIDERSFTRLRVSHLFVELTFKRNDKGHIEDREERNLKFTRDQLPDVEAIVGGLTFGQKDETVPIIWSFVDLHCRDDIDVSIVQNVEDGKLFLEVEGPNYRFTADKILRHLGVSGADVRQVKNSFYDIYVRRQGILL